MQPVMPTELLLPQDPLNFFEDIYGASQRAIAASGGAIQHYYQIAHHKICLSFAGNGLVNKIIPALAHLEIPAVQSPDFTIILWDSTTTKTQMPRPVWQPQHLQRRGEISALNSDRIHTYFQWGANALNVIDLQQNLGIYWINNPDKLPYWESGSPLRNIFQLWFSQHHLQMVHAGAVGLETGGVLIIGKGGSGKSTTALTCLNSDLFYLSDDYTLISANSSPCAYSLYSSAKKKAEDIERLTWLKPLIVNTAHLEQEKALYFLADHFAEKLIQEFPLKAILIPRVTGQVDSTLTSTSILTALTALVPSTLKQLPDTGKVACDRMQKLTELLPSYHLNLGTDLNQISPLIKTLLQ